VTWLNIFALLIVLEIFFFLAISETGKRDFSQSLLNRILGGIDFSWFSCPPRGRSGGILLGVRTNTLDVLASSNGEFHIELHVRNKADNFIWGLVAMCGATQEDSKAAFSLRNGESSKG
jgi:hypothetical protein